jgi:hypothetical protein
MVATSVISYSEIENFVAKAGNVHTASLAVELSSSYTQTFPQIVILFYEFINDAFHPWPVIE